MKLGNCFQVAGRMVIDNPDYILCHAKVMGAGPLEGQRIWHAWCELQDVVFDFSNGKRAIVRKEQYYRAARIEECDIRKYTHNEALKLSLKYKYFGVYPEDEILQQLSEQKV